jgi:hypothetical protein
MKSEKVKEFIDGCINNLTAELADHAKWQLRTAMTHVADLSEQEAEERMRQKAVKAYCHDCCCTVVGECGIGSENCIALRDFIQKLNENEND